MGSKRAFFGVALIVVARTASAAGAEPREARISIASSDCRTLPFDEATFRYLTRVEIEGAGHPVSDDGEGDIAVVARPSTCSPVAASVTIAVTSRRSGQHRERDVPLEGIDPSARSRALALVAAELVARAIEDDAPALAPPATSASPPASPAPTPLPPSPAATPLSVPAPAPIEHRHERHVALIASLDGRSLPEMSAGLVGPTLQARYRLSELPFAFGAKVSYFTGAAHDTLGTVRTRLLPAAVDVMLVVATSHVISTLGPRVEVGTATVEGQPAYAGIAARSSTAVVVLGTLVGTIATRREDGVFVMLGAEVGTTFEGLNAYADDRRVTGIGGPVVGVSLGVGADL